jgi:dTDP-4-amino-4,6-dideoxygalactose transaminase
VLEFETTLASRLGVRHAVAVANATAGLEIAIRAAGLTGEVIVPSFTFVATVHALLWQGLTPVFCDISPATHNLDASKVESLITPRVTGIIGVHVWGRPCAIDALTDIATRHDLTLLFDAAHGLLCSHRSQPLGRFGRAEVLSFHATKVVTSFEGGAIVTNDDELADAARRMRNYGFTEEDQVDDVGTNAKMSEASAAMGLTSLESAGEFVAINSRNYLAYRQRLLGVPGLDLITYPGHESHNHHYVVIEINREQCGLGRDQLYQVLRAENILARRYFYPGAHRMMPYRSMPKYRDLSLPATDAVSGRVLCLPTGTTVDPGDVELICDVIDTAVTNGADVARRLDAQNPGLRCGRDSAHTAAGRSAHSSSETLY